MCKLFLSLFAIVLSLFSNSGFSENEITTGIDSIPWQVYSNTPFEEAKKNNHFILLYGKSQSCHWCQEMDKTTWQNAALIQLIQQNFIPVRIYVESQLELAAKYHINSLPTIMVLDSNNNIIKIFSGYFAADYMAANLKKIIDNTSAGTISQPAVISNPDQTKSAQSLPSNLRDELQKKQLAIYIDIQNASPVTDSNNVKNIDSDAIENLTTFSTENQKIGRAIITNQLNSQQKLVDPVWGGIYTNMKDGKMDFTKQTELQAKALKTYTQAYIYWHEDAYLEKAKNILNYINHFLLSPNGVFYSGQESYRGAQNSSYYQLNDQDRKKLGIAPINSHIIAYENGLMIRALTYYYMATGDESVLAEALKASQWIIDNLSIPGGGFRHEKNVNNILYLNDTLAMGESFVTLYKATQDATYLNRAVLAAQMIDKYFSNSASIEGYFSSIDLNSTSDSNSVINTKENAELVRFTTLLYNYTGDKSIQQIQLKAFHYLIDPSVIANTPPAVILMADKRVTNYPVHITVVGSKKDSIAKKLFQVALAYSPIDARIDWWDKNEGPLLNSDTQYQVLDKSAAYVCHGYECSFPFYNGPELINGIHEIIAPEEVKEMQQIKNNSAGIKSTLTTNSGNTSNVEKVLVNDNWILIILGFMGFGLLISFTPCILPLVPIMASIIVGNTIGIRKEKTFLLCLAYVISMSLTYSLFGILAARFGVFLQIYMETTFIIVSFSLIFLLLGLSMLGAYELTMPNAIQQKVNAWSNLQKGGTFLGVIVMGILSTLIISPCVSAPLLGVLSFITKSGNYLWGAIGLFFMGIGMGLPLLIITVFSKNILPKASRWNNQIKHFFGLILLAASIWIIGRVISEAISMMLWSSFIILTTIYMGITKRKVKTLFDKFWKTLTIMLFIFGIALFYNGLFIDSDLYQSLKVNTTQFFRNENMGGVPLYKNVKNLAELQAAMDEAKQNNLPVLLDFTAKWCSACQKLQHNILENAAIFPLMNQFFLVRVDLTNIDDESIALAHQLHVFGPPIILFFDRNGKSMNLRVTGDVNLEQFKHDLQQVTNPSSDQLSQ